MSESSAIARVGTSLIDDCLSAIAGVLAELPAEPVAVGRAAGRVLARDARARIDSPPFTSSAMDGFAVRAGAAPAGTRLAVSGAARAGRPLGETFVPGSAAPIATGAQLPPGADAVVPIEQVQRDGQEIVVRRAVRDGEHVRTAARYLAAGDVVLAAGSPIGAGAIAALAACGNAVVDCVAAPYVAVITGGDELVRIGEERGPAQIYDANAPMLSAQLRSTGAAVRALHYASDRAAVVHDRLRRAIDEHDAVVVCGGVSVGEHDHVRGELDRLGAEPVVDGLAMRPGRKFWFGIAPAHDGRRIPVFALPGNPVSAFACAALVVCPALLAWRGVAAAGRSRALLTAPIDRDRSQLLVVPARVNLRDDRLHAEPMTGASDAAPHLASADALLLAPAGDRPLAAGDEIEYEAIDG